jgi:outer membrane protein assembly factor BamA
MRNSLSIFRYSVSIDPDSMDINLRKAILVLFMLSISASGIAGQEKSGNNFSVKIDSVSIRKNWRTRETIIMQELDIKSGDIVTTRQIENSISRIWNIGNFAKVNYRIDTLENGRIVLNITAQDALTIMPNFSFSGNREEYVMTLGANDNNFLGRNINFGIAGTFGTNVKYGNLNIGIPRQLLYRNMTLNGGFSYGASQNYRYEDGIITTGVAYRYRNISLFVGNPYQTDYKYTFSPNLAISYFNHKTDSSLLDPGIPDWGSYNVNYLTLSTNESVGLINHVRHQQNGYLITAGIGYGIGLDKESPGYFSFGVNGIYSRLINRFLQIDAGFSTGYTTASVPSLISYLGPAHVKGILTGEKSGKSIWYANTAALITYINRDWFAVEQSFFVNMGNAADVYWNLFTANPLFSAGSRVRFMIPMVPWLAINFYYAYRGNDKHWYSMDF